MGSVYFAAQRTATGPAPRPLGVVSQDDIVEERWIEPEHLERHRDLRQVERLVVEDLEEDLLDRELFPGGRPRQLDGNRILKPAGADQRMRLRPDLFPARKDTVDIVRRPLLIGRRYCRAADAQDDPALFG